MSEVGLTAPFESRGGRGIQRERSGSAEANGDQFSPDHMVQVQAKVISRSKVFKDIYFFPESIS